MKIAVLTGAQPRHLHLIKLLAENASEVCAVCERSKVSNTAPGQAEVLKKYFAQLAQAEESVFGAAQTLPKSVRKHSLISGELSTAEASLVADITSSDLIVVFGSSYIRQPLLQKLVDRRALNIHLGVSPYYRGTACNFWALYDGRTDLVGATIHLLSAGIDSGDILFHALPAVTACDSFTLGMQTAKAAQEGLVNYINNGSLLKIAPVKQNRSLELRYSKGVDFNAAVAQEFLGREPTPAAIKEALSRRKLENFISPFSPETSS